MIQAAILTLVFLVSSYGAWLTFTPVARASPLYVPAMVLVSIITAVLFAVGAVHLDDAKRIFKFSLYYDIAVAGAYYVLPLAFLGIRVPWETILGGLVVLVGVALLHAGSE